MAKRPVIYSRNLWRAIQGALVISILLVTGAALYAVAVIVPSLTYRLSQQTTSSQQQGAKLLANGLSTVGADPDKIKNGKATADPTNNAPITPAPTYVGVTGPAGASGPPGGRGVTGPSGAPGPSGPSGRPGPSGPRGSSGKTGSAGNVGAAGSTGVAGITGPSGQPGPSGAQGIPGPAGQDGQNGKDGADGKDGGAGKDAPVFVSDQVSNNGDGTCIETWTLSDGSTITTNDYACSPAPSQSGPSPTP